MGAARHWAYLVGSDSQQRRKRPCAAAEFGTACPTRNNVKYEVTYQREMQKAAITVASTVRTVSKSTPTKSTTREKKMGHMVRTHAYMQAV
jgi:hypothetical protein